MAIHRFKCSKELNDAIIEFSQIHKFDLKDNLIEQFDGWIETNDIKELIKSLNKSVVNLPYINGSVANLEFPKNIFFDCIINILVSILTDS